MQLLKFRIRDFRSIVDTDWIECQQITSFVGINESGKTSILMALIKLMDPTKMDLKAGSTLRSNIGKMARIALKYDLPIDRSEELMVDINGRVFIEVVFSMDASLNEQLAGICGRRYKSVKEIYISKTYGSVYNMSILDQFPDEADREKAILLVLSKLPAFLYYKEVTEIVSDINLVAMAYKIAGHKKSQLTMREVIYANLLNYLDIWQSNLVRSIEQIYGDFESEETKKSVDFEVVFDRIPLFKERFDRGFSNLNEEFKKWWGRDELRIAYEVYKRGIRIVIHDQEGKAYLLENRSTGFRRFFSLFLSFSVSAKQDFENAIMLFDEAGAALHPLTQRKLANYFMELGKYCQVMYNTHSSYMLPPAEMNRAKIVYKDYEGHSRLSPTLYLSKDGANNESLFAVQASLAMHLAESSLVGVFPIAVLNYQDMSYLQVIRDVLIANGKLNTIYDILIFTGGVNGIDANAEIFSAGDEPPVVLLSSDAEGRKIKTRLLNGTYKDFPHKVHEISDFMKDAVNFEDIMPARFIHFFLKEYLEETLGQDFKYEAGGELTLNAQIEKYAQKKGIELSPKYRQEMAKSMKLNVRDRFVDTKIPGEYATVWKKIMKTLLKVEYQKTEGAGIGPPQKTQSAEADKTPKNE
ncbi:MAG: ATP-binding protein [Firmicutes bacterium]|nr:ATP-binding protein [Bacillota bacterium]